MKWLCSILAIIVLILSAQPVCASISPIETCCDSREQCDNNAEQNEGGTNNKEKDCTSGCNPFQICACCAFCVITPHNASFRPLLHFIIPDTQWGILSMHFLDEPVSGFWQPPRAS